MLPQTKNEYNTITRTQIQPDIRSFTPTQNDNSLPNSTTAELPENPPGPKPTVSTKPEEINATNFLDLAAKPVKQFNLPNNMTKEAIALLVRSAMQSRAISTGNSARFLPSSSLFDPKDPFSTETSHAEYITTRGMTEEQARKWKQNAREEIYRKHEAVIAINKGDPGQAEMLLNAGVIDLYTEYAPAMYPLQLAAKLGHTDLVRLFLKRGAKVDALPYGIGYTPLQWAAYGGYAEIVRLLIENGANTDIGKEPGETVLQLAQRRGHTNVVRTLETGSVQPNDEMSPTAFFLNEVMAKKLIEQIIDQGKTIFFKDRGIQVNFDAEALQILVRKNTMDYITVQLGGARNIHAIFSNNEDEKDCAFELAQLINVGVFLPAVLQKMGFSQKEVDANKQQKLLHERLHANNVSSLMPISRYAGKNTTVVLQGDAYFLIPQKSEVHALYTFGAGPCMILIAVAKDTNGITRKVGMAHVDASVKDQALGKFFSRMKNPADGRIEVCLISGNRGTSLQVLDACDKAGAHVTFAQANFGGLSSHAALVDINGDIYYGEDRTLTVDSGRANCTALQRTLTAYGTGQQLIFKDC